jgi:hypothetical protein
MKEDRNTNFATLDCNFCEIACKGLPRWSLHILGQSIKQAQGWLEDKWDARKSFSSFIDVPILQLGFSHRVLFSSSVRR